MTITEAYYTDLDYDEVLDIIAFFDLSFDGSRHHRVKINVHLTLPSGFVFSYKWIIRTQQSEFHGQINFYDHVFESGFYKLTIEVKSLTGGVSTGTVEYEFDPPGGSGGGDPMARLM